MGQIESEGLGHFQRILTNALKRSFIIRLTPLLLAGELDAGAGGGNGEGYYTEGRIYGSRPGPTSEMLFGVIGTTGLQPRIYPGVVPKVEKMD